MWLLQQAYSDVGQGKPVQGPVPSQSARRSPLPHLPYDSTSCCTDIRHTSCYFSVVLSDVDLRGQSVLLPVVTF